MDLFHFDPATFLSFLLTFVRISMVLFLLPFFGGETVPAVIKAALCMVLTLAVWPALSFPGQTMPANPWSLAPMLLGEVLLGLILSLFVQFIFAAIQTGGQIIGFQMGYTMVSVVDPMSGESEAVTAHFLYMTSMLTFMVLNGHLMLLQGMAQSFKIVPPGGLFLTAALTERLLGFSGQMFILAVKIAAPVMGSLFLVDLALALVGRAAPQMNVMMLGFPVKTGVGFLFLGLLFTIMSDYIRDFVSHISPLFFEILSIAH